MNRTRWRLSIACLAVIVAAVAVAGGSAGNRDGIGTLAAVPGPGSVTYGENIAYSATFDNTSGAVFTQVKYQMPLPVATFGGTDYPAELVASSCGATVTNGVVTCSFGQLRPSDPPQRLTLVFRAPTLPSATGCPTCLVASGTWLIKEGKATNGNESFPVGPVPAKLLAGQGSQETLTAGGYELGACTPGGASLSTNQALSAANPVATSFCLPPFATSGIDLGLATTITEETGNAQKSKVCIAALGTNCGSDDEAVFSAPYVTHVFRVLDSALPNGYKITEVRHNENVLPLCSDDPDNEDGCVVAITPPRGQPKVWTILATSPTNGPWNW